MEKLVPELRFPGFEGEWAAKRIKNLASISSGLTPLRRNRKFFDNGEHIWVKTTDLNNSQITQSEELISDYALKNTSIRLNPVDSILVAMYGGFNQIGRTGILKVAATTNQAISVINVNQSVIYPSFLLLYLNTFVGLWRRYAASSRKDPNITSKDVGDFLIKYPTLPEQTRIATFLTAVDKRITLLQKKKEALEQYKKGIMQKLFTPGENGQPALRFKDDNGRDYPNWEEKKLGDVAEVNPKCSALPDHFVYIDLESVVKGHLIKETWIEKNTAPSRAQRLLSNNDILFQMVRPYQKNNLLFKYPKNNYVASTGYAQIRTKMISEFLFQKLHTSNFVNKVLERCTGTSYPAINSSDLEKIKILVPSLPEQHKIANFLSSLDMSIAKGRTQLENSKEWKKGLLQRMFV